MNTMLWNELKYLWETAILHYFDLGRYSLPSEHLGQMTVRTHFSMAFEQQRKESESSPRRFCTIFLHTILLPCKFCSGATTRKVSTTLEYLRQRRTSSPESRNILQNYCDFFKNKCLPKCEPDMDCMLAIMGIKEESGR